MLWMLLPDGLLPLVIAGIGLALMVGLLNRSAAFGLLGMLLLFAILSPIIEGVMGELPPWITVIIMAVVVLALLRGVASFVLGSRAADHMVGILAADLVRLTLRLLILPFRALGGLVRLVSAGRF
jgi:hypothetical protein